MRRKKGEDLGGVEEWRVWERWVWGGGGAGLGGGGGGVDMIKIHGTNSQRNNKDIPKEYIPTSSAQNKR